LVTRTNDPLIKRRRFAHSPNRAGHASPLRLGRCSATDADSSRPGRVVGPSLGRPGGAHGVLICPSQVCSRIRVADHFWSGRAHLPVHPAVAPRL